MKVKFALFIACSFITICSFSQINNDTAARRSSLSATAFKGINGRIFDSETEKELSARIVISNDTGIVSPSYYSRLPGYFTEQDGSFELGLMPGNYTLAVYHGIDYLSQKIPFTIDSSKGVTANVYLKPWYPLKKQGWYNGDGHDHLYTDVKEDSAMVKLVRRICLAQGIDFVCAAQGWAGYNDSNWRKGYAKYSDDRFTISYGSEMPKYRTGHTWWLGQQSTRNYFWRAMDTVYENEYFQSPKGTTWDFKKLPFPFIPDVELVKRFKTADNSVAVMAHPTSWWWQKRGDVEKYVTNVAVNLPFSLLSGKIWDGLVVMGYDHDHYFYQNLWFHVLNEGYRMPAFSELDGGLGKDDKFYYGSMRTYYHIDNGFTIPKLTDAAKKGRTFVTSGPIIMTDIDNRYKISDVIPSDGKKHNLNIRAYASGDMDDVLSYIIVFRNGKIFKLWDIREQKLRTFKQTLSIIENERAWYIVKVYGKNAWKNHSSLDVMRVCEKIKGDSHEYREGENDVAISSPFYFWRKEDKDPSILQSKINLTVTGPDGKIPAEQVTLEILSGGKTINSIKLSGGKSQFSMPVNGILKISAKGFPTIYRSLYIDYPPHQKILEDLASGRWMNNYDSTVKFNPGEVPWKEFQFEKARKILSDVQWTIEMTPNERDHLWQDLDVLFNDKRSGSKQNK